MVTIENLIQLISFAHICLKWPPIGKVIPCNQLIGSRNFYVIRPKNNKLKKRKQTKAIKWITLIECDRSYQIESVCTNFEHTGLTL